MTIFRMLSQILIDKYLRIFHCRESRCILAVLNVIFILFVLFLVTLFLPYLCLVSSLYLYYYILIILKFYFRVNLSAFEISIMAAPRSSVHMIKSYLDNYYIRVCGPIT